MGDSFEEININATPGPLPAEGLALTLSLERYEQMKSDGYFRGITVSYRVVNGEYLINLSPEQRVIYDNNIGEFYKEEIEAKQIMYYNISQL